MPRRVIELGHVKRVCKVNDGSLRINVHLMTYERMCPRIRRFFPTMIAGDLTTGK